MTDMIINFVSPSFFLSCDFSHFFSEIYLRWKPCIFQLIIILRFNEMKNKIDMKKITFRNETPEDYRAVENLTREAFWNVYCRAAMNILFCIILETETTLCRNLIL